MLKPNEIRIAIKKKNGRKHIVSRIDFKKKLVFVFGPVASFKNKSTSHLKGFSYPISSVDIVKIEKSVDLAKELFNQGLEELTESGHIEIVQPGKNPQVKILKDLDYVGEYK